MSDKTLIVRLSEELHRAFKVKCAQEGENMNSVMTAMIESYVKEKLKKQK
jgi:predicted HicB family RNase H-like nuclease